MVIFKNYSNILSKDMKELFIKLILRCSLFLLTGLPVFSREFRFTEKNDSSSIYYVNFDIENMLYTVDFSGISAGSFSYILQCSDGKYLCPEENGKDWKETSLSEAGKKKLLCRNDDTEFRKLDYDDFFKPEISCVYRKGESIASLYPVLSGKTKLILPKTDDCILHVMISYSKSGSHTAIAFYIPEGFYSLNEDPAFLTLPSPDFESKVSSENDYYKVRLMLKSTLSKEKVFSGLYENKCGLVANYLYLAYEQKLPLMFDFYSKSKTAGFKNAVSFSPDEKKKFKKKTSYLVREAYSSLEADLRKNKLFNEDDLSYASLYFNDFSEYIRCWALPVPEISRISEANLVAVYDGTSPRKIYSIYNNKKIEDQSDLSSIKDSISLVSIYGGDSRGMFSELIGEDDSFCFLSLLHPSSWEEGFEKPLWNVIKASFETTELFCTNCYEESSPVLDNDVYPWIPNTGEWLYLTDFYIKEDKGFFNSNRSFLSAVFLRAEDTAVSKASASSVLLSNLYKNRASAFEIRYLSCTGESLCSGKLIKNEENVYIFENSSNVPKLSLDSNLKLVYEDGKPLFIAIRPVSFSECFPGDDLTLLFDFSIDGRNSAFTIPLNMRLAVYDKKMLSRANLYLDESQIKDSGTDWNVLHPWDAPCSSDYENEAPSWWSLGWGYNEWNRICMGSSGILNRTVYGLSKGKGKQSVFIEPYSSLRYGNLTSPVRSCVSYDYNCDERVTAWDSPFDFNFKLALQKEAMGFYYGTRVSEGSVKPSEAGVFPKNQKENIPGNTVSNSRLSIWNTTSAPNGIWDFYCKDNDASSVMPFIPGLGFVFYSIKNYDGVSYTRNSSNYWNDAVFPSVFSTGTDCMGFALRSASYSGNNYLWCSGNKISGGYAEGKSVFDNAVRAIAFPDKINGACENIVTWLDIFDEGGKIVPKEKDKNGNALGNGVNLSHYIKEPVSLEETEKYKCLSSVKEALLLAVPGDVACYGSSASDFLPKSGDSRMCGSHIGIIRSIDTEKLRNAVNFEEVFSSVEIIESVYAQMTFGVAARNMLETGSSSKRAIVGTYKDEFASSWIIQNTSKIRQWCILRLICK